MTRRFRIVRATAVKLTDGYGPEVTDALIDDTRDPEPLISATAVNVVRLQGTLAEVRWPALQKEFTR